MEDLRKYNPEGSTLRKAQLRMLDILLEIDKIFRKHGIEYWLEGGTLLGAVRHRGKAVVKATLQKLIGAI